MIETATFAAGCFWGVEEVFRQTKGVVATAVGYSGGTLENPTYEAVCTDRTGHAEAVQVRFDPSQVSYQDLLDVFWNQHDPTTRDRQGPNMGAPVPLGDFLPQPHSRLRPRPRRKDWSAQRQVPSTDCHRDPARGSLLAGRGLTSSTCTSGG